MSSYENRCVKIGVVFHALYLESEVSDPQFFCISDKGNSLPDCSQTTKKICVVEVFRMNVLNLLGRLCANQITKLKHMTKQERPGASTLKSIFPKGQDGR